MGRHWAQFRSGSVSTPPEAPPPELTEIIGNNDYPNGILFTWSGLNCQPDTPISYRLWDDTAQTDLVNTVTNYGDGGYFAPPESLTQYNTYILYAYAVGQAEPVNSGYIQYNS